jgi:thiamine biosynthesis lipoprotein
MRHRLGPRAAGARPATFAALALACVAGAGPPPEPGTPRVVTWRARTMGTYAHVTLVTADSAASAPAAVAAHGALHRVDSLMSNWTTTSEVARINRDAGGGPIAVHPEVAVVLAAALEVGRESAGAFDITVEPLVRAWGFLGGRPRVPTEEEAAAAFARVGLSRVAFDPTLRAVRFERGDVRIDLGGIAKGYAVAVAAESLARRGVTDALIDLSGNMAALGRPPGSPHWRIGIRDPRDRMSHFARVPLRHGEAISTSGKYQQFVASDGKTYGHILNPRTGRPAEGPISVTVISRSAFLCDAWDTPLFVLGAAEARGIAKRRDDIEVVLVAPGDSGVDTVWVEESLRDRFALDSAARRVFRVRYF